MPGDLQKTGSGRPFAKRLQGAAIFLSIIAFLLGLGWISIAGLELMLTPLGSFEEFVLAQNLPPRETLTVVDGRVVSLGEYVSNRRPHLKPKIEYSVDGKIYSVRTVMAYAPHSFPYQQSQTVPVLYLPNEPERAWLKWEYDDLIGEYESAVAEPLISKISRIYNYAALGIFGLCALLLTINLFFPFVRYFVKGK